MKNALTPEDDALQSAMDCVREMWQRCKDSLRREDALYKQLQEERADLKERADVLRAKMAERSERHVKEINALRADLEKERAHRNLTGNLTASEMVDTIDSLRVEVATLEECIKDRNGTIEFQRQTIKEKRTIISNQLEEIQRLRDAIKREPAIEEVTLNMGSKLVTISPDGTIDIAERTPYPRNV